MPSQALNVAKVGWASELRLLSQQLDSDTDMLGTHEPLLGEKTFFDVYGKVVLTKVTQRNQPNVPQEIPRSRRMIVEDDYEYTEIFPRKDMLHLQRALEPDSQMLKAVHAGFKRQKDITFTAALAGTAYSGKNGTVASNIITAHDAPADPAVITPAAIMDMKLLLQKAEAVNNGQKIYFIGTYQMQNDLMQASDANLGNRLTSTDFVNMKSMINGDLPSWMGIEFTWTNIGTGLDNAGTDRDAYMFPDTAMVHGDDGADIAVELDVATDRQHGLQLAVYGLCAAARIHDDQVVRQDFTDDTPVPTS